MKLLLHYEQLPTVLYENKWVTFGELPMEMQKRLVELGIRDQSTVVSVDTTTGDTRVRP